MKCLRIDQIYLYLEKELSLSENTKIEAHLTSCLKCKKALEERKIFHLAVERLPLWSTPPDFTSQVMARIFPEKVPLRSWIAAVAAGFASIILVLSAYFLLSGQNLVNLFISLNSYIFNLVRNISVIFIKIVKLISVVIKIFIQLSEYILKCLSYLTTVIGPEIQIILIILTLILSAFILYGVSRKLLAGENA